MSCKSVQDCSVHNGVLLQSNSESKDTLVSQCSRCHCSLVNDDVVEHSQCLLRNCRIQAPKSSYCHKTPSSEKLSSVQAIHSNSQPRHHKQMHQRHLNLNSLQWSLFGSILLLVTIFSSLFTVSFAHKSLPWDSHSIEDVITGGVSQNFESPLVPDLVAISGHLFHYQILTDTFGPRAVHYQVQGVGQNELPKWLSFNRTSATFRGVPLLQDQGKLYITLHVYSAARGGSLVVAESLFSITVVTSKVAVASDEFLSKSILLPDWYNGTNCLLNYRLFKEDVVRYPHCYDDALPVITSVVTAVKLNTMSGFVRADLFSSISEMIGICPHLLVVDSVDWSSREGMKLWRQLTETGITKYIESTTILSFQLSCSAIDFNNASIASVLSRLDQYLASQLDETTSNERGTSPFLYFQWFVLQGSEVLLTSGPTSEEIHLRLRRQNINGFEDSVEDNVFTATLPSSSAGASSVVISLSSSESIIGGTTAYAMVNSSPSRIAGVRSSSSAVSKMTEIEITSPHPIPHPTQIQSHVPTTTSILLMTDDHMTSTDISSVGSTMTPIVNLQTVTSPHPTPSLSREQITTSTRDDHTITSDISSFVVSSVSRSQITLSYSSSTLSPKQTTTSSLLMKDDIATVALTQAYNSTIDSSMPQSTNVDTLPSLLPSSRVIPAPTLVDFTLQVSPDSSIESSQTLPTASDGAASLQLITPSSRVIPSSEPTLVLKPTSLFSMMLAPPASMNSLSVSPTRSVPVLDLLETVQSVLSSVPESVLPTTSNLPSHTFTIAPLDSLSTYPIGSVLGTSIPVLSATFSVQFSVPVSLPPTTSILPSRSFTIRSSIEDLPSSTMPLSVLPPSTTLRSVLLTELPTISSSFPLDQSSRIPETSTLIFPTPSEFFRPTTSDVEPTIPSIFSMTIPSITSILTSGLFTPEIQSSVDVLLPETTTSVFIEPTPTPSMSSELPQRSTSMIAVPDTTAVLSSDILTSSNNILMPMSTSELTVSVSIFTPSPLPSVSVTSPLIIFPTSTQLPILTHSLSSSPKASSLTTSMAIFSSSILSFTSQFTSQISSSAMPSTSLLGTSALVTDPAMTPEFSMFVSTVSPSLLMPMPSSEITASLSIFTPSPSSSVIDSIETSETSIIFPPETILPDTTELFLTMTPTIDSPSQSSSHIISTTVSTPTLIGSTRHVDPTTFTTVSTPEVTLTTTLFSPSVLVMSTITPFSEVGTFSLLESSPFTTATSFVFSSPEFVTTTLVTSSFSPLSIFSTTLPTMTQSSMILSTMIQFSMTSSTTMQFLETPSPSFMVPFTMVQSSITSPTMIQSMEPSTMVQSTSAMVPSSMTLPTMAPSTMVQSTMVPSSMTSPTMAQSTMVQSSITSPTTIQSTTPSTVVQSSMISPTMTTMVQSSTTSSIMVSSSTIIPSSVMTTQPSLRLTMTSSSMIQLSIPSPMTSPTLTLVTPSTPISQPPFTTTPHVTPTPTSTPKDLFPSLLNPIGTLIVNVGQIFQFSIPEDTFYDPESGFLLLTLLNDRGEPLTNTTWIQVQQNQLEGLPLASEITNEAIKEHVFILRAQNEMGSSAYDFVTIRILPQGPLSSFLTILFENEFVKLNQNLTLKLSLVQRLSSSIRASSLKKRQIQQSTQTYNTEEIFVNDIFNESGLLAVSYKNLSIPDTNCAEFYDWIANMFNYTSNEFTDRFLEVMAPEFTPLLNQPPRIEGVCRAVSSNIPPTLGEEVHRVGSKISDKVIFLSAIIPAACVAFCCLLVGVCALCIYRRRRSERKYLTSKRLYLNRRPVILMGEIDLPDRRRVIFQNEAAMQDETLQEERDQASSDDYIYPPREAERLLHEPSNPPPNYRLPLIQPVILQNDEAALQDEILQEERDWLSNTPSDDYIHPPREAERLLHGPNNPPPNYRLPLLYKNENFHDR